MARTKNEKKRKKKEERKNEKPHYVLDVHNSSMGVKTNFTKTENK